MPPPHPSQSPQPDIPSCGCSYYRQAEESKRGVHTSTTAEPCRDMILTQGAARPRAHARGFSQTVTDLKSQLATETVVQSCIFLLYGAAFSLALGKGVLVAAQGTQILPAMGSAVSVCHRDIRYCGGAVG